MSSIDKQSLRTAAEYATPGEWCTDDYHGVIADAGLNANYYIASCSGPDNRANKRFIAAANPATVLALLDELEAAEKRIAELEAREVTLPAQKYCPGEYAGSVLWSEAEVWNQAISECAKAIRAAGIGKGEAS